MFKTIFVDDIERLRMDKSKPRGVRKRNKLVFGVGVNDADYVTAPKVNGKQVRCKIYSTWVDMLRRCYDEAYLSIYPSYHGCSVCSDWLLFSNFKVWMENQDFQGKHLDKDIISPGNKIYTPDYCVFVDARVNLLLTDGYRGRGDCKIGVCEVKSGYQSKVNNDGVHEYLGTFKTEILAHKAYVKRKVEIIMDVITTQKCKKVKIGLKKHAKLLESSIC